jgi:hypothetical protein
MFFSVVRMETDIFRNMLVLKIILHVKMDHDMNSIHGILVYVITVNLTNLK